MAINLWNRQVGFMSSTRNSSFCSQIRDKQEKHNSLCSDKKMTDASWSEHAWDMKWQAASWKKVLRRLTVQTPV
jgi:hypothetical protein